jgi:hypothetical protein
VTVPPESLHGLDSIQAGGLRGWDCWSQGDIRQGWPWEAVGSALKTAVVPGPSISKGPKGH